MGRKGDVRFPDKPFDQRHHCCVGHGAPDLSLPQIHKHEVRERLDLQSAQFIHEVIDVQLSEFLFKRNGVR